MQSYSTAKIKSRGGAQPLPQNATSRAAASQAIEANDRKAVATTAKRRQQGRVVNRREEATGSRVVAATARLSTLAQAVVDNAEDINAALAECIEALGKAPATENIITQFIGCLGTLLARLKEQALDDETLLGAGHILAAWAREWYSKSPIVCMPVLKTLSLLIAESTTQMTELNSTLLGADGVLVQIAIYREGFPTASQMDCMRMAINCMANIFAKPGAAKLEKFMPRLVSLLMDHLVNLEYSRSHDKATSKLLSSSLRGVQVLTTVFKRLPPSEMDALIPRLCDLMVHGLLKVPGEQRHYTRPTYTNVRSSASLVSSESEMSDADAGVTGSRTCVIANLQSRDSFVFRHVPPFLNWRSLCAVRINALACMQSAIKHMPKRDSYKYWATVGLTSDVAQGVQTLMSVIATDPDVRVRIAALSTLASFLDDSEPYLSAAEDPEERRLSSFTPHTYSMGLMLRKLHADLLAVFSDETDPTVLAGAFKCATLLMLNAPYGKLRPGLLQAMAEAIWKGLYHIEIVVQVSAMMCAGSLCSARARPDEVEALLTQATAERTDSLVEYMSAVARAETAVPVLKIEALSALCLLAKNRTSTFTNVWRKKLGFCVCTCLTSAPIENLPETAPETQVALAAAKLIEEFLRAKDTIPDETEMMRLLWQQLLGTLIPPLLSHAAPSIRAVACDLLCLMPDEEFTRLQARQQAVLLSLLLGLAADCNPQVAASSFRALGALVLLPETAQDGIFVQNLLGVAQRVHVHENLAVRIRAFWALANAGDAILMSWKNAKTSQIDVHALEMITDLSLLNDGLALALVGAADNEKVRQNAVRALGAFGRLFGTSPIEEGLPLGETRGLSLRESASGDLIRQAVESLAYNATHGSVKVCRDKLRWNACHALGNILHNSRTEPYAALGIAALRKAVTDCKNFKVRINASAAMAVPQTVDMFGGVESAGKVIEAIIYGIEHIDDMGELPDMKYRTQLIQQLQSTLKHAVSIWDGHRPPPHLESLLEQARLAMSPLEGTEA